MTNAIKTPYPGTFYRRPTPDAEPYVDAGDRVSAGDIVGLVEVMKNFFEVTSTVDGTVERFLVENGDLVDADQDIAILASWAA